MFTGLIEQVGEIKNIQQIAGGKRLFISAHNILDDLSVDDSVAVNGVCLTTVEYSDSGLVKCISFYMKNKLSKELTKVSKCSVDVEE